MREIDSAELAAGLDSKVLVDIRQPNEWRSTGVIKGCHLLTFTEADINGWLDQLGKLVGPEDQLVLVCRTGRRTGVLLDFLNSQTSYRRAQHLAGGILGWIDNDLPVVAVDP
ncbi:MAG: hypothetical protein C0623_05190 [Desulfuromonas sp.]|nr:MAG: hypothetical protein C0623_05190 [Desulfuromonas sp.]